jgi:hypothetical protein
MICTDKINQKGNVSLPGFGDISPDLKLAALSESLSSSLFLSLEIGIFFMSVFHLSSLGRAYTVHLNDMLALQMVLIAHR